MSAEVHRGYVFRVERIARFGWRRWWGGAIVSPWSAGVAYPFRIAGVRDMVVVDGYGASWSITGGFSALTRRGVLRRLRREVEEQRLRERWEWDDEFAWVERPGVLGARGGDLSGTLRVEGCAVGAWV